MKPLAKKYYMTMSIFWVSISFSGNPNSRKIRFLGTLGSKSAQHSASNLIDHTRFRAPTFAFIGLQ